MAETTPTTQDDNDNMSPLQRIQLFLFNIYNLVRNLNLLKQWLSIKYATSSTNMIQQQQDAKQIQASQTNAKILQLFKK